MAATAGGSGSVQIIVSTGSYWDIVAGNNQINGGSGTWDTTTTNWSDSTGAVVGVWAGGSVVAKFGGTSAGTVTVSGTQSMGGLTFNTTGYTLSGGTLTGAASSNVLTAASGVSASISSVLSGSTAFEKQGAGTITLTGTNTFSGGLSVKAGVLNSSAQLSALGGSVSVDNGATLGLSNPTAAQIAYTGTWNIAGTLSYSHAGTTPRSLYVGGPTTLTNATINVTGSSPLETVDGSKKRLVLSGATTTGSGNLNVSNFGDVSLEGGIDTTLAVTVDSTSRLQIYNGTIKIGTLSGAGTVAAAIAGTAPTLSVGNGNGSSTFSGKLSNSAALAGGSNNWGLTKEGTGTITLSGTHTYTGATNINGGTLQFGTGAANVTAGSTSGFSIASTAKLRFNESTAISTVPWANITGAGTLALSTAGTGWPNDDWQTPSLPSSFTGTLLIEKGRVFTSNVGAGLGGATSVIVQSGAQLGIFFATASYPQSISIAGVGLGEAGFEAAIRGGDGGVVSTLTGPVTLTADATVGATGTGSLVFDNVISGANALTVGTSTLNGSVVLNAANTYSGKTTISNGTLKIRSSGTLGVGNYGGDIVNGGSLFYSSSANQTLAGVISGAGTLTKDNDNTSTLTLTGANTFTGAITISAGTLKIGGAGALGWNGSAGAYATAITNNATLQYSSSANQTLSATITGTGALIKDTGTGTLTLSGTGSTYGGDTTVSAGTLAVGANNGASTASAITVKNTGTFKLGSFSQTLGKGITVESGGTLDMGSGGALILNNGSTSNVSAITGTGTITVNAGAQLTITASINNTGVNIVLAGGTLKVTAGTSSSLGAMTQTAASTLDMDSSTSVFASLRVSSLNPGAYAMKVDNWALGSDRFYATNVFSGPLRNVMNKTPLNQIKLGGNDPSLTYWAASSDELLAGSLSGTYWDVTQGNGTVDGGTGTWDSSNSNWTTSDGALNGPWAGGTSVATFGGASGGTVTVSGTQSMGGLTF
ncbi:autotransporter-associated beta strand protein, partial [Pseudacidovorax intermedius]